MSVQEFINNVPFGTPETVVVSVASGTPLTATVTGPGTAPVGTTAQFTVSGTTPSFTDLSGSFSATNVGTGAVVATGTIPLSSTGAQGYSGTFSISIGSSLAGTNLFIAVTVSAGGAFATSATTLSVPALPPVTGNFAWNVREVFLTEGVATSVPLTVAFSRLEAGTLTASNLSWKLTDAANPRNVYAVGTLNLGGLTPQGTAVSGAVDVIVPEGQVTAPTAAVLTGTFVTGAQPADVDTIPATLNPARAPRTLAFLISPPLTVRAGRVSEVPLAFAPSAAVASVSAFFWEARDSAGTVGQTGNVSLATAVPLNGATQFTLRWVPDPALAEMSGGSGQGTLAAIVVLADGTRVEAALALVVEPRVEAAVRTDGTFAEGVEEVIETFVFPPVAVGRVDVAVSTVFGTRVAFRTLSAGDLRSGLDPQGRLAWVGEVRVTIPAGTVGTDTPLNVTVAVFDLAGVSLAEAVATAVLRPAGTPDLALTSVSPSSVLPRDQVTLAGRGFLRAIVNFTDATGVVRSVLPDAESPTLLRCTVPSGVALGAGSVSVTVAGSESNALPLTFLDAQGAVASIVALLEALIQDPTTPVASLPDLQAALDLLRTLDGPIAGGDLSAVNRGFTDSVVSLLRAFDVGAATGGLETQLVLARAGALGTPFLLDASLGIVGAVKSPLTPRPAMPHLINAFRDTGRSLDFFLAGDLAKTVQSFHVIGVHLANAQRKGADVQGIYVLLVVTARAVVVDRLEQIASQIGQYHPALTAAQALLVKADALIADANATGDARTYIEVFQVLHQAELKLERTPQLPARTVFNVKPDTWQILPSDRVVFGEVGQTITFTISGTLDGQPLPTNAVSPLVYDITGNHVAQVIAFAPSTFTIELTAEGHSEITIPLYEEDDGDQGDGLETVPINCIPTDPRKPKRKCAVVIAPRPDCMCRSESQKFIAIGSPAGGGFVWVLEKGDGVLQAENSAPGKKDDRPKPVFKFLDFVPKEKEGVSISTAVFWADGPGEVVISVTYFPPKGGSCTDRIRFFVDDVKFLEASEHLCLPRRDEEPAKLVVKADGEMGTVITEIEGPHGVVKSFSDPVPGEYTYFWKGELGGGGLAAEGVYTLNSRIEGCGPHPCRAEPRELRVVDEGLVVEPDPETACARHKGRAGLTAAEPLQFKATVCSASGMEDVTDRAKWSVAPAELLVNHGHGAFETTAEFGDGVVKAELPEEDLEGTAEVHVETAKPRLSPGFAEICKDRRKDFDVRQCRDGEVVNIDAEVLWTVEPASLGTIDRNGIFTPARHGVGFVVARTTDGDVLEATIRVVVHEIQLTAPKLLCVDGPARPGSVRVLCEGRPVAGTKVGLAGGLHMAFPNGAIVTTGGSGEASFLVRGVSATAEIGGATLTATSAEPGSGEVADAEPVTVARITFEGPELVCHDEEVQITALVSPPLSVVLWSTTSDAVELTNRETNTVTAKGVESAADVRLRFQVFLAGETCEDFFLLTVAEIERVTAVGGGDSAASGAPDPGDILITTTHPSDAIRIVAVLDPASSDKPPHLAWEAVAVTGGPVPLFDSGALEFDFPRTVAGKYRLTAKCFPPDPGQTVELRIYGTPFSMCSTCTVQGLHEVICIEDPHPLILTLNGGQAGDRFRARFANGNVRFQDPSGAFTLQQVEFTKGAGNTVTRVAQGMSPGSDSLSVNDLKKPAIDILQDDPAVPRDERTTMVVAVASATWLGIDPGDGQTNLTSDNPASHGGGFRIFPDQNQSGSQGKLHNRVKVRATITPAKPDVDVFFAVFDADDPTDHNGPIDNDGGAPGLDNRGGAVQLSKSSAKTDAAGVVEVEMPVTMRPGDNFRVVAACSLDALVGLKAKQADSNARVIDAQGAPVSEAATPGRRKSTPLLSVWRRLNLELDSMAKGSDLTHTGNIDEVTNAGQHAGDGVCELNGFEPNDDGRFEGGKLTVAGSGSVYDVIDNIDVTIDDDVVTSAAIAATDEGKTATITDDDVMQLPRKVDISLMNDKYRPAYIEAREITDAGVSDMNTGFIAVVSDASNSWYPTVVTNRDRTTSPGYWVVLLVAAHQGAESSDPAPAKQSLSDGDPDFVYHIHGPTSKTGDPSLVFGNAFTQGNATVIFLEAAREWGAWNAAGFVPLGETQQGAERITVVHEVAHHFGIAGHTGGTALAAGSTNPSLNFNEDQILIMRKETEIEQ